MSDTMRPAPCDRVIKLIIDGEVWRTIKSCDMHIQDAIKEVRLEAQRRMMNDGMEHSHGVHLCGVLKPREEPTCSSS